MASLFVITHAIFTVIGCRFPALQMRALILRFLAKSVAGAGALLLLMAAARAQTFKNPPLIPTTFDLLGLATLDVNHDGKLDLIYIDGQSYAPSALHVLLGNGDGTFIHAQDVSLPTGICASLRCAITVADVTGDGNVDIILGGSVQTTPEIAVLIGNGDGTFQPPILTTFSQSNNLYALLRDGIGVGDLNGDGAADLVVPDSANDLIYVLLGDNTGKFTLSSTITNGTRDSLYLEDINGDGKLDIVATDLLGAGAEVLLGNGDGTFQPPVRYTTAPGTGAMLLTDVDGDGHPDLVAEVYPGQIMVLKGNPDGTFAAASVVATVPTADVLAGTGDFNGDGQTDLTFLTPAGVGVLLGKGGLTYGSMQTSVSGYSSYVKPVVGDFNMDGHADIAMPVEGGIALLFGKGDGTFASADGYDVGQLVGSVTVADFNGDKFLDIAAALPATFPRLLLGNGLGNFALATDQNSSYGSQSPAVNIAAADFNGDGKSDIAVLQVPNASSYLLLGNGNGSFDATTLLPSGSVVAGDLNNDGRADLVSISGGAIVSSLGQTNGTFTTVSTPLRNPTFASIAAIGDVNHDGKQDLLLVAYTQIEVWLGNGDGSFQYSGSFSIPGQLLAQGQSAAIADLDGDGNADLVLLPNPFPDAPLTPLAVFYGNGDGTFQAPVMVPISHRYTQVIVSDVNRDGKPDLVLNDGNGIAVMLNLGGRKFDSEEHFVAGQTLSTVSVQDVNGDGFPDIVAANPSGTTVTVLLNQPNGTANGAACAGVFAISPEPSNFGQPFTLTLTVSGVGANAPVPTGTVSFSIDGAFVTSVPLTAGAASYSVSSALIPVPHTIIATYNGDKVYAPKSFAAIHVVQPPTYTTQTALTAAPSSLLTSQTVRLVATVTSTPPVPSGIVTFLDGGTTLGSATIDANGNAYHDTALLSAGAHFLTATFQGFTQPGFAASNASYTAAVFAPSTSSPATVSVTANATTTSLSSSASSPTSGTVVTFTATVASGAGTPFGDVTFYDGSNLLGTMGLKSDGTTSFSTASLGTGAHSVTASFNANGPFGGSASAPSGITVSFASPGLASTFVSFSPEINPANGSATLVANVIALNGTPVGTVTFLDQGAILGTAETDGAGLANLRIKALPSGVHSLTASFSGASLFAPSVSSEIRAQWPQTGPGFALQLGSQFLRVAPGRTGALRVSVVPIGAYNQQVQLSCAGGVPTGYGCSFSPATLSGGGTSTLTIRTLATRAEANGARSLSERAPFYGLALGLIFFFVTGAAGRRMHAVQLLLLLICCCTISLLGGCSVAPPAGTGVQKAVLTIRALSGSGSGAIVQSTQVVLLTSSSP